MRFVSCGLLAGLLGCSSGPTADATPSSIDASAASSEPAGSLADTEIEALATQFRGLAKMNLTAYRTAQHLDNPMVNIYANDVGAASYRSIDAAGTPDGSFAFPAGTLLVKEMLDPAGGPPILTVMYKKTSGWDPSHGDWWYGRLDATGTPTNPAYAGRVDFCIGCHSGTAKWDYAWGVASSNKAAR